MPRKHKTMAVRVWEWIESRYSRNLVHPQFETKLAAKALGVNAPALLYHLNKLERDGKVHRLQKGGGSGNRTVWAICQAYLK